MHVSSCSVFKSAAPKSDLLPAHSTALLCCLLRRSKSFQPLSIHGTLKLPDIAGAAEANGHTHEDSRGEAKARTDNEPKSPQEWVELLVQQMAGAKDLDDARSRASQILQAFEQAVLQQAFQVSTPGTISHLPGAHRPSPLHGSLKELLDAL